MKHACVLVFSLGLACAAARADDWTTLGGGPSRNAAVASGNLRATFDVKEGSKDVLWIAELGDQTYSSPVIAGGRVFIGTNNAHPRNPEVKGDRGIMMAFSEKDGSFLWQAVHEKLPGGDDVDWEMIGIPGTPCVSGNRVYYVSNRTELVCCDVEGFADGENDGPFKDEARTGKHDADIVWTVDMRGKLGVHQFMASASSPVAADGLVFVVTGNGVQTSEDGRTVKVKNPDAPSFLAVRADTGEVAWSDNSPGDRIMGGQWGSPAYGVIDGVPQVVFGGGDGWLYAFEPSTGKLLWKFDGNGHLDEKGRKRHAAYLSATPVVAGHRVLAVLGKDCDDINDEGCIRAIDARKRGDITKDGELWRHAGRDFGLSLASPVVSDGLVYALDGTGYAYCFDLESGERVWRHDLLSVLWWGPTVADGKLYIRSADGEIVVLPTGREQKQVKKDKLEVLAKNRVKGLGHGTVVFSGDVLYLASSDRLYAVKAGAGNGGK